MTSNVGSEFVREMEQLGFALGEEKKDKKEDELKDKIRKSLERRFRPEFLNRLDDIIVFNTLSKENLKAIVEIQLAKVAQRLRAKDISLKITAEARNYIAKEGYDPNYGARPLRRFIENKILNPLAERLVSGTIKTGGNISVDVKNGEILIESGAERKKKTSRKKEVASIS